MPVTLLFIRRIVPRFPSITPRISRYALYYKPGTAVEARALWKVCLQSAFRMESFAQEDFVEGGVEFGAAAIEGFEIRS